MISDSVFLGQTHGECFPEADTGERVFCESKHVEGRVTKGSSLSTHMSWSALQCVVEIYLSWLHGEKSPRETSGGMLGLLVASKDSG